MAVDQASQSPVASGPSPYGRLLAMALVSFAVMYLLMFTMIDSVDDVVPNLDQLYMAGAMTAAMVVLELLFMRDMYPDAGRNAGIIVIGGVVLVAFLAFMRQQTGIGDRQLLESMIPHHSSATHMCKRATLSDPEVVEMCEEMISTQEREIGEMKAMLRAAAH